MEPIYARYGAPVNVGNPQKPGYTFTGWSGEIPKTMPVIENPLSFTAKWEKGTAGFTVVFWYENANDDGYSVAGTFTPADVAPGTQKSSGDYQNQSFDGRDDEHFTYNSDKAETVNVNGDGSTVLNVYFKRNSYTLTFKDGQITYTCGKEAHEHTHDGWYYKAIRWNLLLWRMLSCRIIQRVRHRYWRCKVSHMWEELNILIKKVVIKHLT